MLIRLPLAFILGLLIYLIAMAMTVFDGFPSLIFQPIVGSILTSISLLCLCVIGSPLLVPSVWHRWRRVGWWALLLTAGGVACFMASWHPSLRVKVLDPDSKTMVDSFQPVLATGGWLLSMFGLLFCPRIGFRGDRRWA